MIFTKLFVLDLTERAIKTAAQSAVALLSVSGINLISYDWQGFVSTVGFATLLSVLSSIASTSGGNSASLAVDSKVKGK